nr:phosphotransferase [Jiangella mangrovi]
MTGPDPVVCHHDPGPNNTVFRAELPVALIDFDLAAPGEPLEDVGYLAWTWCVSSKDSAPSPDVQAHQLWIAADGYGLDREQRQGLVDAMLERQERNARWWAACTEPAAPERAAWSWREHAFTRAHRERFTAGLGVDGGGRR